MCLLGEVWLGWQALGLQLIETKSELRPQYLNLNKVIDCPCPCLVSYQLVFTSRVRETTVSPDPKK